MLLLSFNSSQILNSVGENGMKIKIQNTNRTNGKMYSVYFLNIIATVVVYHYGLKHFERWKLYQSISFSSGFGGKVNIFKIS